MSSVFKVSLAGVALATIAGCSGMGGSQYVDRPAYLMDSSGQVVMAQGYATCVRAQDWTPARGIVGCGDATAPKPAVKAAVAPPPKKPAAKPEAKPAAKPAATVPNKTPKAGFMRNAAEYFANRTMNAAGIPQDAVMRPASRLNTVPTRTPGRRATHSPVSRAPRGRTSSRTRGRPR